ncbi:MAG TPA: cation diffusion facilitator family transporter [Actinomycetota bacterium]|jgi:cobalt-zinc-cadmium efflux system protein
MSNETRAPSTSPEPPRSAGGGYRHSHHLHPHLHPGSRDGPGAGQRRALLVALGLTAVLCVVQTAGAILSGSLALLADSGHLLSDVASLALALVAMQMARRPPTPARTYGWHRAEVLAALANGAGLAVIAVLIFVEAARRFAHPPEVEAGLMLVVAAAGLAVNLVSMVMLRGHRGESLNVRGAYLHVVADSLGSVGAIAAAVVLLATGWERADPVISVGIGLLVLWSSWGLVRDASGVLLESTPPGVDLAAVKAALEDDHQVEAVHDLHVWTVTSGFTALSAHLVIRPAGSLGSGMLLERLQHQLDEQFGIAHTTLQVEHGPHAAHLRCLDDPRCLP